MALIAINKNPDRKTTRQFAAIWFPLMMAAVAWMVWRKTHVSSAAIAVAATGVVVGAAAFALQPLGRALFVGLSYVTFPIGFVVSNVVVGVLYYGVITPIGLIMRLLGRDPMARGFDRGASTYWVKHTRRRDTNDYFRQF